MKLSDHINDLLEAQKMAKKEKVDPEIFVMDEKEIVSQIESMCLNIGTNKEGKITGYIMYHTRKDIVQKNE